MGLKVTALIPSSCRDSQFLNTNAAVLAMPDLVAVADFVTNKETARIAVIAYRSWSMMSTSSTKCAVLLLCLSERDANSEDL
eukprot:CAMPEP_0197454616 /NCGR_PEP_ID=MMETSP1175-20131217/38446_1 /TAXON_ID=1003142 /ORGANISM="Triceratium dubium, Strain CCMP147" /LENGTH=81 /DNA_ID=CAMNT_0042988251 /DNA_START=466 /DNA_END=708 /DNA_ORIENTATION=-